MAEPRANVPPVAEPMLPVEIADSPASNQRSQGQTQKKTRTRLFFILLFAVVIVVVGIVCYFLLSQDSSPSGPGLGFEPVPENSRSTLISFKGSDKSSYQYWVDTLSKFLDDYLKPGRIPSQSARIRNCDYHDPPNRGQFCHFDPKSLGECREERYFGFYKSSPCIILKSNKILGWIPEYYNNTDDLPPEMPQYLRNRINEIGRYDRAALNNVWVTCEGETPADKENIGPIEYYPQPGFPGYYFPYENTAGYLTPLVAVHFKRPRSGVLINIECRIWAKNAQYDRDGKLGLVHFELLVD